MRTRRHQDPQDAAVAEPSGVETSSNTVVSITTVDKPKRHELSSPSVASARKAKASRLPRVLQFPLVAILSLSLSVLGYHLAHEHTKEVLATHVRMVETWSEQVVLIGWRVFGLALGWFGDYDGYDLAALDVLSHGPSLYLLSAFYEAPASAVLLSLAIEVVSTYIPFRLLRSLSPVHADPSTVPNAELLTDRPIALLTSLLSGAIYTVTLFAASATYLPTYLVVYFNQIKTIVPANARTYIDYLPVTLTLGFAANVFIFAPAECQGEDKSPKEFDPITASLSETVWWNVWAWSNRTKAVIKRTAVLMLVTGANTIIQTVLTVRGAELPGAVAYASVWVVAAAVTGFALGVVGSV